MKDVTGQEIQIGDIVVTAQKQGSRNWLNVYPVIGMIAGKPVLEGKRKNGVKFRVFYTRGEDTIAIVNKAPVETIVVPSSTEYDPGDEE
jgi:hypothetical protein